MKKRMFPQIKGKRVILGEGFPYLNSFVGDSVAYIEGVGLHHAEGIAYMIKFPRLKKKQAYRLVLEKLPKSWKSPFLEK